MTLFFHFKTGNNKTVIHLFLVFLWEVPEKSTRHIPAKRSTVDGLLH